MPLIKQVTELPRKLWTLLIVALAFLERSVELLRR